MITKFAVFLSEGAIDHLGEIMREEIDDIDADLCIHCREILDATEKILAEIKADSEDTRTPEECREDEETEDAERRLDAGKAGDFGPLPPPGDTA